MKVIRPTKGLLEVVEHSRCGVVWRWRVAVGVLLADQSHNRAGCKRAEPQAGGENHGRSGDRGKAPWMT